MCAVCSVHFQIQPVAKSISFHIAKPWTNSVLKELWKSRKLEMETGDGIENRNWKQNQSPVQKFLLASFPGHAQNFVALCTGGCLFAQSHADHVISL